MRELKNTSITNLDSCYISRQGEVRGPYSKQQILNNISKKEIAINDLVYDTSSNEWKPIREIFTSSETSKQTNKFSRFWGMFLMVLNPGILLKSHLQSYSWQWALSVSGLAFMLFFVQTSSDIYRGTYGEGGIFTISGIFIAILGFLYGTLGVFLFAMMAWLIVKVWGNHHTAKWTVKAFGLGYSPALVYTTSGLLFNIFLGWNTALTFGIPGILWATRPMMATLKEMTGGKRIVSLLISVFFGCMIFMGWSWFIW
ncbi:GYF domain-containing protein [Natranaerofaba carboxydovora]|uniref:GYF domain-containing protein n=1 Tax=Natranaerofaba carboxydovora TaxID=2742683 RepID=UPI001F13BA52|nr:GYF domain-containing protein [Natranaerofaba carboxydovora]UMZ73690.1 hypothetical protein ACONDI_01255 [Natranaerofaba carboxydovora]